MKGTAMKLMQRIVLSAALSCLPLPALALGKPAHKDAHLYFVWPQNGATIKVDQMYMPDHFVPVLPCAQTALADAGLLSALATLRSILAISPTSASGFSSS
jgi:hypothetical protein